MSDKAFTKLLVILLFILSALTIAHAAYALYAYEHSSVIYFISKEIW